MQSRIWRENNNNNKNNNNMIVGWLIDWLQGENNVIFEHVRELANRLDCILPERLLLFFILVFVFVVMLFSTTTVTAVQFGS